VKTKRSQHLLRLAVLHYVSLINFIHNLTVCYNTFNYDTILGSLTALLEYLNLILRTYPPSPPSTSPAGTGVANHDYINIKLVTHYYTHLSDLAQFTDKAVQRFICQFTHFKHSHSMVLQALYSKVKIQASYL